MVVFSQKFLCSCLTDMHMQTCVSTWYVLIKHFTHISNLLSAPFGQSNLVELLKQITSCTNEEQDVWKWKHSNSSPLHMAGGRGRGWHECQDTVCSLQPGHVDSSQYITSFFLSICKFTFGGDCGWCFGKRRWELMTMLKASYEESFLAEWWIFAAWVHQYGECDWCLQ